LVFFIKHCEDNSQKFAETGKKKNSIIEMESNGQANWGKAGLFDPDEHLARMEKEREEL
jgi:hypothetical protein